MIVATAVSVLLLLVTGGVIVALRSGDDTPAARQQATGQAANADPGVPITTEPTFAEPTLTEPAVTEPATTAPAETVPTENTAVDPDKEATARLEQIWREDRAKVTFRGQYAAQIATKYPGIVDPIQTTADGSHTFMAADILAEHSRLREAHDSAAHPVVLIKSTDYSKRQRINGHFLWATFAIGSFPDAAAVHAWCDARFADLTQAQRDNQCVVRRLNPGR